MAGRSPSGVFYAADDYASLGRRLLVLLVDFTVLALVLIMIMVSAMFSDFMLNWGMLIFSALSCLYLAWMKTTRWGTVGYRFASVRLVDLRGNRASLWRATFRFLFLVLGPLNLLVDLIWLSGDDNRQSLRDKFAGTYVVRENATPVGNGAIRFHTFFFLGNALMFQEVDRRAASALAQVKG